MSVARLLFRVVATARGSRPLGAGCEPNPS